MRARRQAIAVAVGSGAGLFVLLAVAAPPSGQVGLLVGQLLLALVAAVAVGTAFDRWAQARIVDLRHHDLFMGLGPAGASPETRGGVPVRATSVAAQQEPVAPTSSSHQLFGVCACSDCLAGRPVTVDLRADAPRREGDRAVVDLRAGAAQPRRRRLGQR